MESLTRARNDYPGTDIGGIVAAWSQLWNHTQIGVIGSQREYDSMVRLMDSLVDVVGDNEDHPLAGFLDVVGVLIEQF